jgi:uncharacterized protein (TIGR02466 family)
MKLNTLQLFPTPLMTFGLERDFTKEELDYVHSQEMGISIGNEGSYNHRVLENPIMANLKKFAQDALDQYFEEIYSPARPEEVRLKLTQSWTNVTEPGENHHIHYHPNSVISGVIYINADINDDEIVFSNVKETIWEFVVKNKNAYNSRQYHLPVSTGFMVLFPSQMFHGVPETKSKTARISLAFNSFFEGKLGIENDGVNYLEINNTV